MGKLDTFKKKEYQKMPENLDIFKKTIPLSFECPIQQ